MFVLSILLSVFSIVVACGTLGIAITKLITVVVKHNNKKG